MAEGGEDLDISGPSNYLLAKEYTTAETTFTNPTFDDNTEYNTDDNSSLSSDSSFSLKAEGTVPNINKVCNTVCHVTFIDGLHHELTKYKIDYLSNSNFTDGTKWRFTDTNKMELAKLGFTYEAVMEHSKRMVPFTGYDDVGVTVPFLDHRDLKPDSLYMIGKDRGGKLHWVRITDTTGKLLSRSTIGGKRGGKMVAEKLSELSHYSRVTGKYADLKWKQENEADIAQERKREATVFVHNLGSKETGEQIQLQIRKPTPQRSNITSMIEDVINSDVESIGSDQPLLDITAELQSEFGEYDAREIKGLKIAEEKMAETRGRVISKIALLEVQYEDETDPAKKKEIQEVLDENKRRLRYLNDDSQKQRLKKIWIDYLKKPDSLIPLKDRLKLLFKLEGFTIAAIIAAVIMFFATIGLAISNSLRGSGNKPTPSPLGPSLPKSPSIPDRVKEGLKKFAEWLKELAKKSAVALPGCIGSIVSFLLKSAGAVVGFLAEHLVILVVIVVSSVVYGLIEGVKTIKKSSK